ncbi:MAG: helix-turn-helix domain-containing protein [Sedimentisphaerales bacterium]
MGMGKRKSNIEAQLRKAIIESSVSRYRIARECKISEAALSLFVNRKRTLTLTSAAKVASFLGLELGPRARKRKAGAK